MSAVDVVIVGGGFVGIAAAAALADGRRRIVVLEARSGVDPRFRGELIHPHGVAVLEGLGLRAPLARAGGLDVRGFAVVPGAEVPAVVLPYDDVDGRPRRGLSMDHHLMVASLRAEVGARPGVEIRTGARVTGVVREGDRVVGVETADGARVLADLTLVAEGRHSKLRGLLGIAQEVRLLSFTAALLLEDVEVPEARHGHVFLGAPGPVLAYGIGEGRVRMCVDIPASAEKGKGAILALLRGAYAPFVPAPLRAAMLRAASTDALELCANHAIHTHRCAGPGVVLVGDSGGCCHPLTATGLTTGLNDVRVLAAELGAGATAVDEGERLDAALLRYQRRRYRFVRAREILADALYEVFRGASPGPLAVQNGILRYWQGSARARTASMALLSGQESRLSAFLAEYARVVGRSAYGVFQGDGEEASMAVRAASLSGLLRLSYAKLERSVTTLYKDAAF
jgi:2-polyprenyl-6-methoxyphenol hydroxylase-like FAD-dependent oxidoreductase